MAKSKLSKQKPLKKLYKNSSSNIDIIKPEDSLYVSVIEPKNTTRRVIKRTTTRVVSQTHHQSIDISKTIGGNNK